MLKRFLLLYLFAAASLAVPGRADAESIVDQVFLEGLGSIGAGGSQEYAQTFTAGLSGTLARIDVQLQSVVGDSTFFVRSTQGGVPVASDAGILASLSIPELAFDVDRLFSFDVSSFGIAVEPGDVLAFSITVNGNVQFAMSFQEFDQPDYTRGAAFQRTTFVAGTPFTEFITGGESADINFRTFVETGVVPPPPPPPVFIPEPSSIALTSLGGLAAFAGLFARRARRRVA